MTRKSVAELSTSDFERFPVWEFAHDEDGEEGRDETTVRPYSLSGELDPSAGTFVVRARFRLADSTEMSGYLTPPVQGDDSLGTLQPIIVTAEGQVLFWWGSIEPPRSEITGFYHRLGKGSPAQVFPLEFASDVPLIGGPVRGHLPGFLVLEDWGSGRLRVVT